MMFQNKYKKHIVWLYAFLSIGFCFFILFDIALWVSINEIHTSVSTVLYIAFHMVLFLLCINNTVMCVKNNIKIENGFIFFHILSHFFKTKICIKDVKYISFEKNSIIHDAKYDEESIIIDFFINETMYRIALNQNDFEAFKNIPQISCKILENKNDGSSMS